MSCIIFTAFVIISSTIIISFSTTNNAIITMNIKITTRNSTTTITNFTTSSIADTNIFIFCATITTTSTTISISYKTSMFLAKHFFAGSAFLFTSLCSPHLSVQFLIVSPTYLFPHKQIPW